LTYGTEGDSEPVFCLTLTAKDTGEARKGRPYRRIEIRAGKSSDGPILTTEARELLRATYLRPLRDAGEELSAGRGSRLSQVLHRTDQVKSAGIPYNPGGNNNPLELNILGIGDLANALLEKQKGIVEARSQIDSHLKRVSLSGGEVTSSIQVSGSTAPESVRLRRLLEKLDLQLGGSGKLGLGSNNLLFMACELLLLAQEDEGLKLLLIEEPEAHLHPQRQLRVMKYLQDQAKERCIQIIVTTHSPNLASAIDLDNMVMVRNARAYPLSAGYTELDSSDYGFLKRFLDATKANLFFASGVMIVEGDAENVLVPTLANIIGRDFTEHGVSIVNVGGVGLRRYARIFQRKRSTDVPLDIPVACVTDMDVMPNCAPSLIGKVDDGAAWPSLNARRWRAKQDIGSDADLRAYRNEKLVKASGQSVKTFVSDEWTLEYDVALGPKGESGFTSGLAEHVFIAASLAERDDAISTNQDTIDKVVSTALTTFAALKKDSTAKDGCTSEEVLAAQVYAKFARAKVSKPIAAQYLAGRLRQAHETGTLSSQQLRESLPTYLTAAIDYVTRAASSPLGGKKSNG
jgi:putative ATP-dependent endonuclease of OLD family